MLKLSTGLSAVALLAISTANIAIAQDNATDSGTYVSLGAASYGFDTYGIDAKIGYNFNKYFGVEAEGILGLTSETLNPTLKFKTEYTIAAFGIARLPVNKKWDLFARAGYHQTGLKLIGPGSPTKGDRDGFAAGGGVQYNMTPTTAIRAEYTFLENSFTNDQDVYTVSYVRKF